ncbi:Protein CBG24944 [Caenorhabditis briggsae]|uniref:Protein CBG24944 n=1 Tax=Caenorhabditis briggsae TaxID=6238 RepID=A8WLT8_CAEBR|nr:Protein CBG24944 [Caenorhabditis briggsae]CAP21435.1 Protein CBG24944 [Caenorhabditis briggsae]
MTSILIRARYPSFSVRESRLKKRGIKLGDFLSASVPMGKPVENFDKVNYKFTVNVDGNTATIEDQEADLEKNEDEVLVSRVKAFGSVRSIKQNIPVGKYRINIRATKPSEEYIFSFLYAPREYVFLFHHFERGF